MNAYTARMRPLHVSSRSSAPIACVAVVTVLAACGGDDADLWGDAMTPTQMQRMDRGPGPSPNFMTTTQGDSDDPYVDNPSYPFVQGPWWSNPAYNGG